MSSESIPTSGCLHTLPCATCPAFDLSPITSLALPLSPRNCPSPGAPSSPGSATSGGMALSEISPASSWGSEVTGGSADTAAWAEDSEADSYPSDSPELTGLLSPSPHTLASPHTPPSPHPATGLPLTILLAELLFEDALVGDMIGEGRYGSVWECALRETGLPFACKHVAKAQSPEALALELRCLALCQPHPHVLRLEAVYESKNSAYIATELCNDGDLYDYICQRGRLAEAEAAALFSQLVDAVRHCHTRGVVHRDIKPENILLHSCPRTGHRTVRLADFGLATVLGPGEVTVRNKDERRRDFVVEENFRSPVCKVSSEARDLITAMPSKCPEDRPTAAQILSHPWLHQHLGEKDPAHEGLPSGRCDGAPWNEGGDLTLGLWETEYCSEASIESDGDWQRHGRQQALFLDLNLLPEATEGHEQHCFLQHLGDGSDSSTLCT